MSETDAEVEVAEGRGAFTLRGKENGMTSYGLVPGSEPSEFDGASGGVSVWHNRVRRGVRAIDQLLNLAGFPDVDGDGKGEPVFDRAMKTRVLEFQQSVGIASTFGYVGPTTMKALVVPHAQSIGTEFGVAGRWVLAMIQKESGFDPGAQGWTHPPDSGLMQWNTSHSVTLAEAYNPIKAIRMATKRFQTARDGYLEKKPDDRQLAISCAIAQHNSPLWANQWHESGEAPNPQIAEYVNLVREYARDWRRNLRK